jgi:hypothetical protein
VCPPGLVTFEQWTSFEDGTERVNREIAEWSRQQHRQHSIE